MPVGTAIGLGAASLGSAAIGASAAKKAANTQVAAADRTAQMQLDMFNTIRDDLQPYRQVGSTALPGIQALLGLGGSGGAGFGVGGAAPAAALTPDFADYVQNSPDLLQAYQSNPYYGSMQPLSMAEWGQRHWQDPASQASVRTYTPFTKAQTAAQATPAPGAGTNPNALMQGYLESTPGYQFTKQQGLQAVENSLNSRGLGALSGSLGKGIARFVTGLADQTYQQQLGNMIQVAGIGQSAANQTGTFGQNATSAAGSALTGGANAAAAGTVGQAGAIGAGLTGAANAALTSQLLGMYGKKGG